MLYHLEFKPYQRRFRQPLITNHGSWEIREGIILKLSDNFGNIGCGEIAPLPWFGSETLTQALAFCSQFEEKITAEAIAEISDEFPACQFGFESALGNLLTIGTPKSSEKKIFLYSFLLPTGEAALQQWRSSWEKGGKTFKWKIGVKRFEEEIEVFNRLTQVLPIGVKLRLDANGGLNLEETKKWLTIADQVGIVEYIEQPLPPQQFETMLMLNNAYATPLALDESVTTLKQLEMCYQQGWRGIFVIKAAIAGSPKRLRQLLQKTKIDAVFSSVFETSIGRQAALNFAAEFSNPNRAVGFGINDWFEEAKMG